MALAMNTSAGFHMPKPYKVKTFFWQRRKQRKEILEYVANCPFALSYSYEWSALKVETIYGQVVVEGGGFWATSGLPFDVTWNESFVLWAALSERLKEERLKEAKEKEKQALEKHMAKLEKDLKRNLKDAADYERAGMKALMSEYSTYTKRPLCFTVTDAP